MLTAEQIQKTLNLIKVAGAVSLDLQKKGLNVIKKPDGSLVTNADVDLEHLLINGIRENVQNDDIIISEEAVANGTTPTITNGQAFWSIDPIDSTNSYIKGKKFFCINVAYIEKNIPVFGVIYAPALETMWYGMVGVGCFKQVGLQTAKEIQCRDVPKNNAILTSSEEQITPKDVIEALGISQEIKIPSAIKLAYVAEGSADFYVRNRNKACDWDMASGLALILAAGGGVKYLQDDGNFLYGQPPYLSPSLLAFGKNFKQ